jgi:hypothetical protein
MVMQFCTIFFPIFEAYTSRYRFDDSTHAIETSKGTWSSSGSSKASMLHCASRVNTAASTKSIVCTSSTDNEKLILSPTPASRIESGSVESRRKAYSRAALAEILSTNPTALLQFATQRDFTGENIIFLIWVNQWRTWWNQAVKDANGLISNQAKKQLFRFAFEIYFRSVHMKTAAIPINIDGRIRSHLDNIFRGMMSSLEQTDSTGYEADVFSKDALTTETPSEPFPFSTKNIGDTSASLSFTSSLKTLVKSVSAEITSQNNYSHGLSLEMQQSDPDFAIPIPYGFDAQVFDDAEREVNYMVFTNTWPRFVDSVNLYANMGKGFREV